MKSLFTVILASMMTLQIAAQARSQQTISGVILTGGNEVVAGALVTVRFSTGELTAISDGEGNFRLTVPAEKVDVKITGKNIIPLERAIETREQAERLRFEIRYSIPSIHDSLV